MSELLVLATTFPDRDGAERVVSLLVDGGLAVCGQVGADLRSFYRWEGKLEEASEVAVTLKILPERFAREGDRMTRFQREAKVLASLHHQNIASIFGFEQTDEATFLAMELVRPDTDPFDALYDKTGTAGDH